MTTKKGPTWAPGVLPRSLPRPPGDCQDGPKSREERPKSRQNRPKQPRSASGAVWPAIWRPTAPQELPGGLQEVILAPSGLDFRPRGGRLARPRPLHVHPSGEHLPLLLGLSTARPQKSKRLENAKTRTPPKGHPNNRWPRSPWLTKMVGGVAGAIVNYMHSSMHCTMDTISCKLQCSTLFKSL